MKHQSDFGYFRKVLSKILNKVKHEARERQTLGKANQIVGYFQKGCTHYNLLFFGQTQKSADIHKY